MSGVSDPVLNWDAFGERISNRRKKMEISQRALAAMIGRQQRAICDIENGRLQPTIETTFKIAEALDLSFRSLTETLTK